MTNNSKRQPSRRVRNLRSLSPKNKKNKKKYLRAPRGSEGDLLERKLGGWGIAGYPRNVNFKREVAKDKAGYVGVEPKLSPTLSSNA
jgi:hypothetical protein